MNDQRRGNRLLPIALVLTAFVLLLIMGALLARSRYLSRGISDKLPEPIEHGGLQLGINTHLEQYNQNELEEVLLEIKNLGVHGIKQSFSFADNYDWKQSDQIVEAVSAARLELVPLLDGSTSDDFAPPKNLDSFAAWAGEFSQRYGPQVESYIIWDEPNLSEHWGGGYVNPAEYAALLSSAAAEIRANDPGAVIVAAPLAPTIEKGPLNLSETIFLQGLYDAGVADSFDVAAAKPYGFESSPLDRKVDHNELNFSRIILLREVMEANGDEKKALWAGNWGWNSLPFDWAGEPSIWGQVDESTRQQWTIEALERARKEWPWMGFMFLETWEPAFPDFDPHWGFSIRDTDIADKLADLVLDSKYAYPGFQLANPESASQTFSGNWRFSVDFGADIGEGANISDGTDTVNYRFWGTDIGLRVRRADFHGRFYAEVDGEPPNRLPKDEYGSTLVLNSPGPGEDYLAIEPIATGLTPGEHELKLTAHRGSGQWALNGFTSSYQPESGVWRFAIVSLGLLALLLLGLAIWSARRIEWIGVGKPLQATFDKLNSKWQLGLTAFAAFIAAFMGWLTWGEQAAGIYKRLGDSGQLALTAAAASIFYFSPSFLLYIAALLILLILIFLRPAWGLAIVAFSFPLFVLPKPLLGYNFSPVEVFLLVTLIAFLLRVLFERLNSGSWSGVVSEPVQLITADYAVILFMLIATLSLLFTERLDVATNEWRMVIIEPVILYGLLRIMRLRSGELWTILDAFILGGVMVAVIGLWQYAMGENLITSEGGLMRLRSIYGSPNNVALYLGRIIPILAAYVLMGRGSRRKFYAAALIITSLATLLTFSKGSLFIGLPAALLVVFIYWRRSVGGRLWPWLVGAAAILVTGLVALTQIPQLASRLNPQGATGILRLNLWQASWNMFKDHPLFGVGLDNFLYEYRGRYLLDAAWKEPNLNHPHNILLDLGTRLGLAGILTGLFLLYSYAATALKLPRKLTSSWRPISIGLISVLVYLVVHGLVDHSLFLVDLSFAFFFLLGLAAWLNSHNSENATPLN